MNVMPILPSQADEQVPQENQRGSCTRGSGGRAVRYYLDRKSTLESGAVADHEERTAAIPLRNIWRRLTQCSS